MSVIGVMQVFNEAGNVGPAVESLRAAGCRRVVVLDGAWTNPDGTPFGGEWLSSDDTYEEAVAAGAEFVVPPTPIGSDGQKRSLLLQLCGAEDGDHVLFLDADERLVGTIDDPPAGHGCVIHRDLIPNDLPGLGGVWPRGDYGPEKPLLRWLRWSADLRCESPGRYTERGALIQPYLVGAMRERAAGGFDPLFAHAYRVVRDLEQHIPLPDVCVLPLLTGVEIHHVAAPAPDRVEAKRRYYAEAAA